jgi:NADPH-dependent curcumin reductase CurA
VIDYRAESVADVLAGEFKDHLAVHGRLVAAGAAQDLEGRPEIVTAPRIVHKLYYKGASIRGFMNGRLNERWADARQTLFDLYRTRRLTVTFDEQAFEGLPHVYDAVEHLLSGRSMAKVIVAGAQT